jgi:hypothetical protein
MLDLRQVITREMVDDFAGDVLHAAWCRAENGRFALSGVDGFSLWARTMTFADCRAIEPPPGEVRLCPTGRRQDAAWEYVWAPDSAIHRLPGGPAANGLARPFALRAVATQLLDYVKAVASDGSPTFHWTPARHPKRVTPACGFVKAHRVPAGLPPSARSALTAYDPGADGGYRSVEPFAGFLCVYRYPAYLRGPPRRERRGGLAAWDGALVLPVAVLDFDHRHVLPVVPLAPRGGDGRPGQGSVTYLPRKARAIGVSSR